MGKPGANKAGASVKNVEEAIRKLAVEADKKKKNQPEEDEDDASEENEGEGDDEDGEEEELNLPRSVMRRVSALRDLHDEADKLALEYKKERIELEKKYNQLRQKHYTERADVISGAVEPPVKADAEPEDPNAEEGADIVGIPGFWQRALASHPAITQFITEEDEDALNKLTDITVTYNEEYTHFTLNFHFSENEFFSNPVLTKTYGVSPDLIDDKSPALLENKGSTIEWKANKNLTVTEVKKKQKAKSGKNKGQVRTVVTLEPKASFFNFFQSPKTDDDEENEEENEDEENDFKISAEDDYEIGHSIRTSIIPEAIRWFTGEAAYDDEYAYGSDEDDEDGDDDEDEDDEDEDEEDEKPAKKSKDKKKGFAAGGVAPDASGTQPECKQN